MRGLLKIVLSAGLISACVSCSQKKEKGADIGRLDIELRDMASCDTPRLSDANLPGARLMFRAMGYDTVTGDLLRWWSTSDAVTVFQPDVDSVYPDLSPLSRQLAAITASAKKNGLDLPEMQFYTIVWGKPQPLMRDSDVMIIALNHYLGKDYEGYSHWEEYRRAAKTPEMLPYDVAAALVATQIPMTSTASSTLLDWLLYEGALVEARLMLVDNPDVAAALGFTPEQLRWCEENYDAMMREVASRRMLYDTDPVLIDRMLAPSPASPLMANRAPGRVGRYIGYRLVQDYVRKHPSATLKEIMTLTPNDVR